MLHQQESLQKDHHAKELTTLESYTCSFYHSYCSYAVKFT